jgi:hypothetical protein
MNGQNMYDNIPATSAIIALVPALPPEFIFMPPAGGGGGGVDILGGGGGGGAPKSVGYCKKFLI